MATAGEAREPSSWLPDFCTPAAALSVLALCEIVLLVVVFAPGGDGPTVSKIASGTLFVQWLALCSLVALCASRAQLARLPVVQSVGFAYAIVLAIVALGSALAIELDRMLGLGYSAPLGPTPNAVLAVLAVTALVTTVALRYFYVREQWRREERAQARAQVQALQARIRPHFLFNSMNTIASLIATRPDDAERAVVDLSELFRAALAVGDELSDLGRELELIEHYLAIEKLRLGDRLHVELAVDALPRDLAIPSLILQPLVENAVLHGIQSLTAGGTVRIAGSADARTVSIEIENPRASDRPVRPHGNHIALDNIRRRLAFHYGEAAAVEVDAGAHYYRCRVTLPREERNRPDRVRRGVRA